MPKFTIGIPTYNRAKWIGNAIECALAQTYGDVEVIVCDNASTDSTADVVRKFGNRVRYIRNETNIGASHNFLVNKFANTVLPAVKMLGIRSHNDGVVVGRNDRLGFLLWDHNDAYRR